MAKPPQRKRSISSSENNRSTSHEQIGAPQRPLSSKVERIGLDGNVEFVRLGLHDMKPVRVLVQALDNQWIPRALAPEAFKAGQITKQIDRRLRKAARAEYLRALINGEQVIINRAFLYNNPVVSQDYYRKGPQRDAIKKLLELEVIIPYLLGEASPVEPPASGPGALTNYATANPFPKWQLLCQEVRPSCIRLSWDDKENWDISRQRLAVPFNRFAMAAAAGNINQYVQDLGLDRSASEPLRKRLVELGQFCLDLMNKDADRLVTRNEIYEAFITAGRPVDRKYDQSKPFANEVKQLLDLSYNSNLPDALSGYLITPVASIPRTALQEWRPENIPTTINGDELLTLLRRAAFGLLNEGLNIKSMDHLTLQDVCEIRRMDEWIAYMQSLESLLRNPLLFANRDGGAMQVYRNYERLAARITNHVNQGGRSALLTSWLPTIELAFYVSGAVLSYIWTGHEGVYQLSGQIAGLVGGAATPVVGRLIIRDRAEKRAQQDLSTSVDFMRAAMPDAVNQWRELVKQVRRLSGFREISSDMNTSQIVDPNINYRNIEI